MMHKIILHGVEQSLLTCNYVFTGAHGVLLREKKVEIGK
jgi:hypothetical protein